MTPEKAPLLSHRQGALRSHILLDHDDPSVTDRFSLHRLQTSGASRTPSTVAGAPTDRIESRAALERLKRMGGFEAQDFDPADNDIEREFALHRSERDYVLADTWRWFLSIIIGIVMGFAAFLVDWGIQVLNRTKYDTVRDAISAAASENGGGGFWFPYSLQIFLCLGFAFIASSIVAFIEPLAAGSGIPEIKTYLNGVHIKGLLTLRTLVAKLMGVTFSIGAGLIAGKEGPFVHGGGIVGGGIGAMGSLSLTELTRWRFQFKFPRRLGGYFRNAADHRDFTAIGTAAGVATAFAAPIGGLLFCIEEGVSFYSTSIFWRGFLATSVGVLTLHILVDVKDHPGNLFMTKFGRFRDFGLYTDSVANYGTNMFYRVWDLPVFCLMGALGGLLGALFVRTNVKVTQLRHQHGVFRSPYRRVAEVLVLAFITSTIWFIMAYISPCSPLPSQDDLRYLEAVGDTFGDVSDFLAGGGDPQRGLEHFPRLWCPAGQYSRWGQLFMVPLSQALRLILHLGEPLPEGRPQYEFDAFALLVFLCATFGLMCWTNGCGASTGMFVPSLAVGAAGGRLLGRLVQLFVSSFSGSESPQQALSLTSYSVIGAAAFLSGATRMTLTATVMVMETTGALQLIVPLMLAVFFAKVVGDRFSIGIDDTHIRLRGAPVLEEPGVDVAQQMIDDKLAVSELMTSSLIALPPVVEVRRLVQTLRMCNHQAFPVTPETEKAQSSATEPFELHGVVLRSTLLCLLRSRIGLVPSQDPGVASGGVYSSSTGTREPARRWKPPSSQAERVQLLEMLEQMPLKVRVRQEQEGILSGLTPLELDSFLDLRCFMQRAPYVVCEEASLTRGYRLFRTMGLRHMFISESRPKVIGMVSRKDLIIENAKLALGQKANMASYTRDNRDGSGGADNASRQEPSVVLPSIRRRNPLPFIPYSAYDQTANGGSSGATVSNNTNYAFHQTTRNNNVAAASDTIDSNLGQVELGGIVGSSTPSKRIPSTSQAADEGGLERTVSGAAGHAAAVRRRGTVLYESSSEGRLNGDENA